MLISEDPYIDKDTSDAAPAIGFIPYGLRFRGPLVRVALADLEWPLGMPTRLAGKSVGDLDTEDHLIANPVWWLYGPGMCGVRAQMSLMFAEPASFHGNHMRLAKLFQHRYYRVLTSNDTILHDLPNKQYFVLGSTWVPDWADRACQKTRMLSLIASKKKSLKGHRLRHRIATWLKSQPVEADVMGGGYAPFAVKADGLESYRYSVVIENSREAGYFTEKIVDAVLLKTVPIYWRAPDIADFFDPDGLIICETEADIQRAIQTMSEADYAGRKKALEANRKSAAKYAKVKKNAVQVIRATLEA